MVKAIPDGYNTVTPYLVVEGAGDLIEFMKNAFGAEEKLRMPTPDGKVGHAELRIGDSMIMLGDASDTNAPMPAMIHLYVDDTDALYEKAIQLGGQSIREPENMFYGDRSAGVRDRFGNQWWLATHVEDVPPEEMEKRAQAATSG